MFILRIFGEMLGRIVLGLLIVAIGGAMIYFSGKLVEIFGRSSRADAHLGGTRQMRVLLGFGGIVIGGLVMFGIVGLSDPMDVNTTGF